MLSVAEHPRGHTGLCSLNLWLITTSPLISDSEMKWTLEKAEVCVSAIVVCESRPFSGLHCTKLNDTIDTVFIICKLSQ